MKQPIRFAWSRQARAHRIAMKGINKVLSNLPNSAKYGAGWQLRRNKLPYRLVETLNVVQIGAPYDTLAAGRARAAYLGLGAGANGRLLVVEPLASSTDRFREFADSMLECETTVVTSAVWSSAGEVELFVDEAHPATNFSGTTVDYDADRKAEFKPVTVPSNTLDQIVADANFPQPDLVSITTNWAETEILSGMTGMLEKGVRYVCLALGKDGEDYKEHMQTLGYEPLGYDDRGVTYILRS